MEWPVGRRTARVVIPAEGGVATDISVLRAAEGVTIQSSDGADGSLPAATTTLAGVLGAADKIKLDGIQAGATANATDAALRDRSTHTGTQAISTITGLQTALDGKADAVIGGELFFIGDHDGTETGGSDQTVAFAAFLQQLAATGRPGRLIGGVRLTAASGALPIVLPVNMPAFRLAGYGPRASWIYLQDQIGGSGDFFLKFQDRLGLWTGEQTANFVGTAPNRIPPPPPFNLRTLSLADFSIFGRGTDENGNPVARQGGIAWVGRHDKVYIRHVEAFNLYGTAFYFGWPAANGNGGFRESYVEHLLAYRCGSPTEAAVVVAGHGSTFGPNLTNFFACESSLSRGVGWHYKNLTTANTTHNIIHWGLKLHGTGPTGGANNMPLPSSTTALLIEGTATDCEFRGLQINQQAEAPGEYAVQLIKAGAPANQDPPSGLVFDGEVVSSENGFYIEHGGEIDIRLSSTAGIAGNILTVADAEGPIRFDAPASNNIVVAAPTSASQHIGLVQSGLSGPAKWSAYQRMVKTDQQSLTNSTTLTTVTAVNPPLLASKKYAFRALIYYQTTALGDFQYSIVRGGATFVGTRRDMAPQAVGFTETAVAVLPSAVAVTGPAGTGVVEVVGTLTTGVAGNVVIQFAQAVADPGATIILPGTMIEVKELA